MNNKNLQIKIKKRDGTITLFNNEKIKNAIKKAAVSVANDEKKSELISNKISAIVFKKINQNTSQKIINIESIQDIIECALMNQGYDKIAKNYILYRKKRDEIRTTKSLLGINDDLKLSINSMEVLKKRYLLKDDNRNIIETPGEMFKRTANHIVKAEEGFKTKKSKNEIEEKFYNMMTNFDFLPNSPTLMNSKTKIGQLSACFVLPVGDSINEMFDTLKDMAIIHQSGGGTGFDFSHVRPKNDIVNSTKGEASGPLSFIEVYDKATEVIVQGGRRRGANMGILRCDHPDIVDFIESKLNKDKFNNFNFSVGITDQFMDALLKGKNFDMVNPRTKNKVNKIKAKDLFDILINAAWHTGDPGIVFLDEINRNNPTPGIGPIEATNPCGELPLLPYESCNLGSINLSNMVKDKSIDWEKLEDTIKWSIRFLDNVIEVNKYPLPEIKKITHGNRKIGLGVMGYADMLIKCNTPYNSKRAIIFTEKLMEFIHKKSIEASIELAGERGVFPNFKKSIYAKKNIKIRNATVNTIAPTGTISIIANCSSGIEPLFGICFMRNVMSGTEMFEINPIFEKLAKEKGFNKKEIFSKIIKTGSIQNIDAIPDNIKKIFVTTFDISPKDHLSTQAAFQKFTDNSVSKTINLPKEASTQDIKEIFISAYKLKCKGITVYRYGSKNNQVLSVGNNNSFNKGVMTAEGEFSGGCIDNNCSL
jgi:ribonucleoside-diphosphate reductase alpha chain